MGLRGGWSSARRELRTRDRAPASPIPPDCAPAVEVRVDPCANAISRRDSSELPVGIELTTARLNARVSRVPTDRTAPTATARTATGLSRPESTTSAVSLRRTIAVAHRAGPAALAQLVERRSCKADVESSSLSRGSICCRTCRIASSHVGDLSGMRSGFPGRSAKGVLQQCMSTVAAPTFAVGVLAWHRCLRPRVVRGQLCPGLLERTAGRLLCDLRQRGRGERRDAGADRRPRQRRRR